MKGSECRLADYMDGSKKRFIIPVYQRNYDWNKDNCKQLYDDLVKVIKSNRQSHFFGSIVSVYEPSGKYVEYVVIDGQQRLTTVSLLLLAMRNLIVSGKVIPQEEDLGEQIYDDFLADKHKTKETRIKLKPVKNDQNAFVKLFEAEDEHDKASNLTANYDYFYKRIQEQEVSVDELLEAIYRLEIINIELTKEDDPQLIFESLNSTGLALSEGDKIRNYILMNLPSELQNNYYERYWNPIEKYTKYDVSGFIRDYLSVKQNSTPAQKKIYIHFKEYVEKSDIKIDVLLRDMLFYAKRYSRLLDGQMDSKALNACIYRLNRLETTVTRPFFLEVLRLLDDGKLNLEEVTDIFLTTENYLFRRTICDLPTNSLNKIFLMLNREILAYDGSDTDYVRKFKYALLAKTDRARFPDDKEFVMNFEAKAVYQMTSKNKLYILERLENFGTKEDKDVYARYDEGDYSIEHIMPQHLTPAWIRELGSDYEKIHEIWLHRIANLTLTAYNSEYSNSSFTEKKTTEHGFNDSGIRLNNYIAKKDRWTVTELMERNQHLLDEALKIWEMPISEFKPEEKQLASCTLEDEDVSLTGRYIVRFRYKNSEQPVSSWAEMFQKVLQIFYDEDKTIIRKLAESNAEGLAEHFSLYKDKAKKDFEVGEGVYVWANTSTQGKISILSRIFKLYSADLSDLTFYLRDDESGGDVSK